MTHFGVLCSTNHLVCDRQTRNQAGLYGYIPDGVRTITHINKPVFFTLLWFVMFWKLTVNIQISKCLMHNHQNTSSPLATIVNVIFVFGLYCTYNQVQSHQFAVLPLKNLARVLSLQCIQSAGSHELKYCMCTQMWSSSTRLKFISSNPD